MPKNSIRLEDKGPIQSVPLLREPYQSVSLEIQSWPQIIAAAHWDLNDGSRIDGADFYVGDEELGHIHLSGELHLATSKLLRDEMIKRNAAQRFTWYDSWVQFRIVTANDALHAMWLFRLNYDRLCGRPIRQILERVAEFGK